MELAVGDKVRYQKRRCCGRRGFDWTVGTIRSIREFEGNKLYLISGYGRYVRASEIEKVK